MAIYRRAKQVPWYYAPKEQCEAEIMRDNAQCSNSATYEGFPSKGGKVNLCKIHAAMSEFPVKEIGEPGLIKIRED